MPHTVKTAARGYGGEHQRLREVLRPHVEAGECWCWRCGMHIDADDAWDVGHDDRDRSIVRGPEHASCNRRAPRLKAKRTPEPHPNRRTRT